MKNRFQGSRPFLTTSAKSSRRSRCLCSSADSTYVTGLESKIGWKSKPGVVFPWRHDEALLPRLMEGAVFGPGFPTVPGYLEFLTNHVGGLHLQVPWSQLFRQTWKQELADSGSWAFSQAVAGVLSNSYEVPFEEIQNDEGVKFNLGSERQKQGSRGGDDDLPDINSMLEKNLRLLYESSHESGKSQIQIELDCTPKHARFLSLLWIPFLTRDADPTLRRAYPRMLEDVMREEIERGRNFNRIEVFRRLYAQVMDLANARVTLGENASYVESTLIAQVLVQCDEIFRVVDLETGLLLQGQEDGKMRSIPHVIRLETVVKTTLPHEGSPTSQVVSWQITDWDDLLEGNIWFV